MKYYLTAWLLLFFYCSIAQKNGDIVIGKSDSIDSKILNEKREVWVYVPSSAKAPDNKSARYPVVYLLDGDGHFYSVAGMVHQFSQVNGNTLCPEMIIVGIRNTDRMRDLTPTHVSEGVYVPANTAPTSGGGEKFTAFIEQELMPHIDSLYPTAPYRMMIGHSLGGLMVVNTLVHHTNLFNAYLAIDPSMWWDNQKLLKETQKALAENRFDRHSFYLGIANTMEAGQDTMMIRKDTSSNSFHIRSILQLADALKAAPNNGLNWQYRYYNDDDHGSVPLIAEYDALRFIFKDYRMPSAAKLFDPAFNTDSAITAHFHNVSNKMGYPILPPEGMINQMGYYFLQSKQMEKAYRLFQLNIDNYPKSFNVYDSMGDYFSAKGDAKQAADYFTRALALEEHEETRKKLEDVKGKTEEIKKKVKMKK